MSDTAWIVIGVVVVVIGVALVFGRRLTGLSVETKAGKLKAKGVEAPPPSHTGVTMEGVRGKAGVSATSDTAGGVTMKDIDSDGKVVGKHRQPGGQSDPKS